MATEKYKQDYQREFNIGAEVAEQEIDFLCKHFVTIPINETVRQNESNIILGRKGSGKTALRIFFERKHSPNKIVLSVYPEAREMTALQIYLTDKNTSEFFANEVHTVWEIAFYILVMRGIIESDNSKPTAIDISNFLLEKKIGADSESVQDSLIAAILFMKKLSEDKSEALLEAHKIIFSMRKLVSLHMAETQKIYYILIDSVDDNISRDVDTTGIGNDLFRPYFEGLLSFFRMFINRESETFDQKVHIKLFIPRDIYSWAVIRHDDHFSGRCHYVQWEPEDLEGMILERLRCNVPDRVLQHVDRQMADKSRELLWNMFVPEEYREAGPSRYSGGPIMHKTRKQILSLSIGRPRDLILLMKEIAEATKQRKLSFPDQNIMESVFQRHSRRLKGSVVSEYGVVFPRINELLGAFSGNKSIIDKSDFIGVTSSVLGSNEEEIRKACYVLYNACVIGAVCLTDETNLPSVDGKKVLFATSGIDFTSIWAHKEFAFHRAFHHAIQLKNRG